MGAIERGEINPTLRVMLKLTRGPAVEAVGLEVGASVEVRRASSASAWPQPFGALAGELPPIEIEDIKAARRDALRGGTT